MGTAVQTYAKPSLGASAKVGAILGLAAAWAIFWIGVGRWRSTRIAARYIL